MSFAKPIKCKEWRRLAALFFVAVLTLAWGGGEAASPLPTDSPARATTADARVDTALEHIASTTAARIVTEVAAALAGADGSADTTRWLYCPCNPTRLMRRLVVLQLSEWILGGLS